MTWLPDDEPVVPPKPHPATAAALFFLISCLMTCGALWFCGSYAREMAIDPRRLQIAAIMGGWAVAFGISAVSICLFRPITLKETPVYLLSCNAGYLGGMLLMLYLFA